jgi:alkylhydroperoxidase family enzyme
MGDELVQAAIDDLDSAPIPDGLRATLAFLEKLTLLPEDVGPDDVERVVAAGVSPQALRDAIEVCAQFNVIDRVADAVGFRQQSPRSLAAGTYKLIELGYV